jgi:hypothetical protein
MPLDPSILAQGKPFQAPDPLQNYAKVLQIQGAQQQLQNAGIQQQVSQMQLEDMQRDRVEMVKFQQELVSQGKDPDLRKYAQMLLSSPKHFQTGVELLQKLDGQDKLSAIMGGGTTNALAPVTAAAAPTTAPVNALAKTALPAPGMRGGMPGGMPEAAPRGTPIRTASATPMGAVMVAPTVAGGIPPQAQDLLGKINKLYALGTPQAINTAKGLEAQLKFYEAPYGETQRLQMEREKLDLAKQQAEEGKVPVGYRKTATGDLEAVKGGPADLKSQAQFAQDTTAYNAATSSMDRLATAANEVLQHPGLPGAVGLRGAIPNIPGSDAANAAALLETLKSQVGFSVLQDMRNASKTGGALGNISNEEGKRLEANLATLNKAQDISQFQSSLKKIIQYTEGAKDRLKNAYELKQQSQGKSPVSQPAPASVTVAPNIDALLNKYK